jgi:hypothetical protein
VLTGRRRQPASHPNNIDNDPSDPDDLNIDIDIDALRQIWFGLDTCWADLDSLRFRPAALGLSSPTDAEAFVAMWQMKVFECRTSLSLPFSPSFVFIIIR